MGFDRFYVKNNDFEKYFPGKTQDGSRCFDKVLRH